MNKYIKILVVDDEFIMRQGITHMIDWEKEGFHIIGQASNGQEAIEIIKENTPDIIISDVVMPQVNGIELAEFIQAKYPEIKIIILSSYSDFEYVKSSFQNGAIDYILKPSLNPSEILKTLKKISVKINNTLTIDNDTTKSSNILTRLLLGFDTNIDFDYLKTLFVYPNFCLFGLNAKKMYNSHDERQKIITYINSEINMEFSSAETNKEYCTQTVSIENEIIIMIINFNNKNYNTILSKLDDISKTVYNNFCNAFFVLSKTFNSIDKIKTIYEKDFLLLTDQYFYNKNTPLLCSKDFKEPPIMDNFNFKCFSDFISLMQFQNAFDMLTQYIKNALTNKAITEFQLKTLIQNAFYNVITSLEYLSFDSTTLNSLKYDCFHNIDNVKYSEELMITYESLLEQLHKILDIHENKINSHIINKIIQYIHDHYDEQLTLADVSKLFNFNYSYLSAYFSSHNEEGFNEFLNKIRIKKACDFLKQDIPISDISSMVGYSDHSYFCKVFKKFTGLTPSSFRKSGLKIFD